MHDPFFMVYSGDWTKSPRIILQPAQDGKQDLQFKALKWGVVSAAGAQDHGVGHCTFAHESESVELPVAGRRYAGD